MRYDDDELRFNGKIQRGAPPRIERRLTLLPDGRFVNAVIGYRAWFINYGALLAAPRLRAMTRDEIWEPHEILKARCLPFAFQSASDHVCRCNDHFYGGPKHGIYAYQTHDDLLQSLYDDRLTRVVTGEVALFGEVNVHERGYRASHALIVGIHTYDSTPVLRKYSLAIRNARGRCAPSYYTSEVCHEYGVPLLS